MLNPETQEQIALFDWIRLKPDLHPYSIHIPNEGRRSKFNGWILKRMGMRSGVSDVFIAVPRGTFHGVWIELKAGKNKATANQTKFIVDMLKQGYYAQVCMGAEEAIEVITSYLAL